MRGLKLFKRPGIEITRNNTRFIGFGLIAWRPASGYFPRHCPGLSPTGPWTPGMVPRQDILTLLEIKTDLFG
jgi:hypothetical protein